jgi:hypothetical protein
MLIIGGTFPDDQDLCDNPLQYGTHNLNLGKNGPDGDKWVNTTSEKITGRC